MELDPATAPSDVEAERLCTQCDRLLSLTDFGYKNRNISDQRRTICRQCAAAQRRRSYQGSKEQRDRKSEREKQRRVASVEFVREYKESNPCVDCGGFFSACAMDFDHVTGNKSAQIGGMMGHSMAKMLAEIEKCELVCSNCHRVRTHLMRPRPWHA